MGNWRRLAQRALDQRVCREHDAQHSYHAPRIADPSGSTLKPSPEGRSLTCATPRFVYFGRRNTSRRIVGSGKLLAGIDDAESEICAIYCTSAFRSRNDPEWTKCWFLNLVYSDRPIFDCILAGMDEMWPEWTNCGQNGRIGLEWTNGSTEGCSPPENCQIL